MNIKIGSIIKKLSENNVTQDTLACAIGVTPQAISRWESESGYPDIEFLPALADFFSVSTDELLGYKLSEREKSLADIKSELERLAEVGGIDERIAYARNALALYPSDFEIKDSLAVCLYHKWTETKDEPLLKEAEILCKSIVDDCKTDDIRYDAVFTLISIYDAEKRPDKALEIANTLTPMKYCRETVLSSGIGDGKTEFYIQDEIDKLTDALGLAIRNYALDDELPNDPSTWDKKTAMLKTSNELYRMIYGDDLMFYHNRLSMNCWLISTYEIAKGNVEETLDLLEKMCFHAKAYDDAYINDHGKYYTSIYTDKLIYPEPGKDFHELREHNDCYTMLDRMSAGRYDCIRDNERFVKVVDTLRAFAK